MGRAVAVALTSFVALLEWSTFLASSLISGTSWLPRVSARGRSACTVNALPLCLRLPLCALLVESTFSSSLPACLLFLPRLLFFPWGLQSSRGGQKVRVKKGCSLKYAASFHLCALSSHPEVNHLITLKEKQQNFSRLDGRLELYHPDS